jgi:dephospho-CoA kinase
MTLRPGLLQVGLTGNAASGKSTVARWWAEAGVPVVSADALARQVVAPGSPGLAEVVEAFGDAVLTAQGELDRPALRARILEDPGARARLEAITHPRISALREEWIEARRGEGHPLVVSEIPLLFEVGLEEAVDRVVLVAAPRERLVERLERHRGMNRDEALALLSAQVEADAVRARAHHVLENGGTLEELRSRADELLAVLRQEAGA